MRKILDMRAQIIRDVEAAFEEEENLNIFEWFIKEEKNLGQIIHSLRKESLRLSKACQTRLQNEKNKQIKKS